MTPTINNGENEMNYCVSDKNCMTLMYKVLFFLAKIFVFALSIKCKQ